MRCGHSVPKLARRAKVTARCPPRPPFFCPEQPKGTLGAPPLLLLTVPASVRPEGSLQPVPSSTCFTSHLAPVGSAGARARGLARAHAHRGSGPAHERAPQGPVLPRALAPLDHSSDRLLPAALSEPPPPKPQRGALCSLRPSGAWRGGPQEVRRREGRAADRALIG